MSAHELEHPKEERPGFTGLTLGDLKKGMVLYRQGDSANADFQLCRYIVFQEANRVDMLRFWRIPIGSYYSGPGAGSWYAVEESYLMKRYGTRPNCRYLVVDGLELPDELMFEVYRYCKY